MRYPIAIVFLVGAPIAAANSSSSVCRIENQMPGFLNVGSGTLIDVTENGREGLVLSCWHLFREGVGKVTVQFPDGRRHGARLVAIDEQAHLAALVIANPRTTPVQVSFQVDGSSQLRACGYGQSGQLQCVTGPYVGESKGSGQQSVLIGGAVRSGDSGGGVFNQSGELVAVVWGERDGVTYASCGMPLRAFLGRILGRRQRSSLSCPDGLCPRQPMPAQPLAPMAIHPSDQGSAEHSIVTDPRFEQLATAIKALRVEKQDRGDYLTSQDLANFRKECTLRHDSVLEQIRLIASSRESSLGKSAGAVAANYLGLSGPVGWAVLVGGTAGGWLLGRFMSRKFAGAGGRRRPFPRK